MNRRNPFSTQDAMKLSFRCSARELEEYNALGQATLKPWGGPVGLSGWIRLVLNGEVVRQKNAAAERLANPKPLIDMDIPDEKPTTKRKGARRGKNK